MSSAKYSNLTREQLLEYIETLEAQINKTSSSQNDSDSSELKHKKRYQREKNDRPFDMSKYTKRKIALQVAYIGWNYCGYASQNEPETLPTIEDMLFKALISCKLVEDIEQSDYSRCGRTDKGVSGLGQVIALNVRSKKLQSDPSPGLLSADKEYPYIDILNRLLPSDVRVLSWAPVNDDFNARFNCTGRTYKYFFPRNKMNIDNMRKACTYFEGPNDFRNFCKLDPSKNVLSYERIIMSMKINPVQYTQTLGVGEGTEFYEVELKGTAFLWHQVRFMMSVLFLVGQGLEAPEIVRDLLDIEKVPSKPNFPMASDLPLVLYDCEFKGLEWTYSFCDSVYDPFPSSYRTYLHYNQEWTAQMIRALTCQNYLSKVANFPVVMLDKTLKTVAKFSEEKSAITSAGVATIVLGGGKEMRINKYKPVLEMPRCDTDELKKRKFEVRKKRKLDKQEEAAAKSFEQIE
ncbi:pseudouridine synthase [Parasitella parasitica]|nr:pseudouridine synthase [Parasitella parasitica]